MLRKEVDSKGDRRSGLEGEFLDKLLVPARIERTVSLPAIIMFNVSSLSNVRSV